MEESKKSEIKLVSVVRIHDRRPMAAVLEELSLK